MKKTSTVEDDLITVQDAAALRGVSKARIHQWIKEGRIAKEVRYGRTVVSRQEVLAIEALPGGRPRKVENETGLKVSRKKKG